MMNMRTLGVLTLAATVCGACGEDEVQPLQEQVVNTTSAEDDCEFGGTKVETGIDDNGDGELQPDEVDTTEVVCSGDPGDQGDPGLRSLVRTTEEPDGDNCPNGGQRIESGVDVDGDGQLDDGEVDATTFVCRGEDGEDAPALLTRSSTATEDECDFGGVRIESGFDANDNLELDPEEIDDTRIVCDGEDGEPVLTVIDPIPPGEVCSAGGRTIRTGVDENRDGQLSDPEILDEQVLCDPVSTLVVRTELVVGTSTVCANGGERIDVGLDVNANGTLEAVEIDTTSFVCNGEDGLPLLTRRRGEPPGPNCELGGVRISYGVDQNDNKILEANEEETITFACDGEDGQDSGDGSAARVSNEPPGENCVRGGTRIETGPDVNGNGQLDDSEVTNTTYACDGQSAVGLVAVSPEPPGANCTDGGQRIESGPDSNANGVLDPGEVQSTTFVCSTIAQVPIRIETDATLNNAIRDNAYSTQIEAIGGVGGGYQWTITNPPSVPNGLTLAPSGTPSTTLSGTPTSIGTFAFEVEVTDFFGNSTAKVFNLTVEGTPLSITTFSLPRLEQSTAYSGQLEATGGATQTTPATWAVVEGSLPSGLTLNGSTGEISGTPQTDRGSFFVVEADDGTETARAGIYIKGEQKFGAYCGDYLVNGDEDISVFEFSAGPTVTSTGTVVDGPAIDADCFEDFVISNARDLIVFIGTETTGIDELYAVDLTNFPTSLGNAVKLNPTLATSDNDVQDFKISPTGDWVAFRADDRDNFDDELFVYDLTSLGTASPVRVNRALTDIGAESEYQWIPGTNKLLYISDEVTSGEDNLYFYDADAGGTSTQVNSTLVTFGDIFEFAVSPDGQRAVYVGDQDVASANRLYLVDVGGSTPGTPIEFQGTIDADGDIGTSSGDFGFSPNGAWVHFIGDINNGGDELWARSVLNPQEPPILLSQDLTNAGTLLDVFEAVWSPDGRRIVYRGDAVTSGLTELFLADVLTPQSPVRINPTLPSGRDVNSITGDEFAWDPDGRFVLFDADPNSSGSDEPYLTFVDDPSNPVRVFAAGLADDFQSVKVADDGSKIFLTAEENGTTTVEFFLAEVDAGTLRAPISINDPSPLGSNQDVDEDFELVDGGEGVFYVSDEITADDEEGLFRPITGTTVGARTVLNPTLPSFGDVGEVTVQEE